VLAEVVMVVSTAKRELINHRGPKPAFYRPLATWARAAPGTSITNSELSPSKYPRASVKMRKDHAATARQKATAIPTSRETVGTSITTKHKMN
jgi:hypothetical protein